MAALLSSCAPTLHAKEASIPRQPTFREQSAIELRRVATSGGGLENFPIHVARMLTVNSPAPAPSKAQRLWTVRLRQSSRVEPSLIVHKSTLFASGGLGLSAIDFASGVVQWRRSDISEPFVATDGLVFASQNGGVIAVDPRTGRTVWIKKICGSKVEGIAHTAEALVAMCAAPPTILGLQPATGGILYRRSAPAYGTTLDFRRVGLGYVEAAVQFSGAWSGMDLFMFRAQDGRYLGPYRDAELLLLNGASAYLNDRCCLDRTSSYKPAVIEKIDMLTGQIVSSTVLAPQPERFSDRNGEPLVPLGSVVATDANLYLKVGDALFRYSWSDLKDASLIADGMPALLYVEGTRAIVAFRFGERCLIARLDLGGHAALTPLYISRWIQSLRNADVRQGQPVISIVPEESAYLIDMASSRAFTLPSTCRGPAVESSVAAAVICYDHGTPYLTSFNLR